MVPLEHSVESEHSSPLAIEENSRVESASRPDATGFSGEEAVDSTPNAIAVGTCLGGGQFVNPVEVPLIPRFPWNAYSPSKAVRKGPA